MKKHSVLFTLLVCAFLPKTDATVRYVDASNLLGSTQNGASWATAYPGIQSAINQSVSGDSIFVAQGNYTGPTMHEGVKLYGGFLNTYTAFSQRNWQTNATKLQGGTGAIIYNMNNNLTTQSVLDGFTFLNASGYSSPIYNYNSSPTITNCIFINCNLLADALTGGGAIENSSSSPIISNCTFTNNHVTQSTQGGGAIHNINSNAIITGCTFTGNSASGILPATQGGNRNNGGAITSVSSNPTIINCVFISNTSSGSGNMSDNGMGGALYNLSSTVNIDHCIFQNNTATGTSFDVAYGGAISNVNSTVTSKNCKFSSNTSTSNGGAISNSTSTDSYINCLFNNNSATYGGAIYSGSSVVKFSNCTIASNSAPNGGAFYHLYLGFTISNSIIWGNSSGIGIENATQNTTYSLIQNQVASITNHNLDGASNPFFVDTANANFQLSATSPCINTGNNDSIPTGTTTDLASNGRIFNAVVDMGAYESESFPLALNVLYFTGKEQENNSILLEWQIADNEDYNVELQCSSDGKQFKSIYEGTTQRGCKNAFHYNDNPIGATNFYRLKLNANEGFDNYSNVIFFKKITKKQSEINIYPNPTSNNITLITADPTLLQTEAIIKDAVGKVIKRIKVESNNQNISLFGLKDGTYFLNMSNGSNFEIIKQH